MVKSYFEANNVPLSECPARSLDMNIIENLWRDLARTVYAKRRQFSNIKELKECILVKWEKIKKHELKNFVNHFQGE